MTATTHPLCGSVCDGPLYVALEISEASWTVALTSGFGIAAWVQTMTPGDGRRLAQLVSKARARFGLPPSAPVLSCYEAGRAGFWIHRWLGTQGVRNRVVDSASIEVNRRARRNKTDRIDARKLVALLVRVCLGERTAWREVRVPTEAEEAARHVSRERTTLVAEQTRLINQLRGWLAAYGTRVPRLARAAWWTHVVDWSGAPLPAVVQDQLARASERLGCVRRQIAELDAQQAAAVAAAAPTSPAGRLRQIKGVAPTSVSTLLDEGLVWRQFRNRRQVGGMLGFAPVHFASGALQRDQGISHAGNRYLQSAAIQLAWSWVRWQRQSALTQWYLTHFGTGKRLRRIGIVALARKLVIALWRTATAGGWPEGAVLKTT